MEDNEEDTYTMQDIIKEEEMINSVADAVLGDSDDNGCSYSRGYIRQALYSCSTCSKVSDGSIGICLGCSLNCHDGHEVVEIYTKRHFRCDCGNGKLFCTSKVICQFQPEKDHENQENQYNQNFQGKYCTCHRPYPDPEVEEQEDMIQCCVCEDWYHERHLGETSCFKTMEDEEDYDEVICSGCMKSLGLLYLYNDHHTKHNLSTPFQTTNHSQNYMNYNNQPSAAVATAVVAAANPGAAAAALVDDTNNTTPPPPAPPAPPALVDLCIVKKWTGKDVMKEDWSNDRKECTFWKNGWRSKLCKCSQCHLYYEEKQVLFLMDESDTLEAYEQRSKRKRPTTSPLVDGVKAFTQSLSHTQQIELARGYQDMTQKLRSFLDVYAQNGQIVGEEDIRDFFQQLQSKRRKNNPFSSDDTDVSSSS